MCNSDYFCSFFLGEFGSCNSFRCCSTKGACDYNCCFIKGNSPLAKNADYVIVHGFEKDYAAKLEKMNNILMLAVEVLNQYEGYDHYEDMVKGSENIYAAIEDAVSYSLIT